MTFEEAKVLVEELSTKINHHNYLYYTNDAPEISDQAFDKLLKQLEALENQFPELKLQDSPSQRVGGEITKEFPTITHTYPMLSLGNTYSKEDLVEFDNRVQKGLEGQTYEYVCELKYDGVALSVSYKDHFLTQAVTRGDGIKGDEITNNAKTIKSLPLKVAGDITNFEVRGEVFLPLKEFKRVNAEKEDIGEAPLANPRNAASGTLKMQDSGVVAKRNLNCFIYGLLGENIPTKSHSESLQLLKTLGFNVPDYYKVCNSVDAVFEFIEEWQEKRRELPLDTDGIVIKINNYRQQEQLGYTAKSPRWAIAYKYESESAATLLEEITYQVGRTGAITPVANLSPVSLAGTTVRRASLHNANEIERLDIRVGDTVFVEKGGEIIPKVTGVDVSQRSHDSQPTHYITNCPECDTKLVRSEGEASHYCPNELGCPPQIKGRIEHFIQRKAMNMDGFGKETIEQLYEVGLLKNLGDIYALTYDQLIQLDRFADKSVTNLLEGIKKSSETIPFPKVLFALGIRFVGATVAEKLADHFHSITNLSHASFDELINVDEIGERIANSIVQYFAKEENLKTIEILAENGVQLALREDQLIPKGTSLEGLTFVVSGVFTLFGREELKALIKSNGGKVVSSISGKLDYLIAGENMGPSKLEKAEKLAIKIISEEEFNSMIN